MLEKISSLENKRLLRLRELICLECGTAEKFAYSIGILPQNLSRYLTGKTRLSDKLYQKIKKAYPKYNLGWIMGNDEPKLESEIEEIAKQNFNEDNKAFERVIEWAYNVACSIEKRKAKDIVNAPELYLINALLRDYSISLMRDYLRKEDSFLWNCVSSKEP